MKEYAAYSLGMLQATPFLLFDGNCAEAMTFYRECLGGKLTLTKLGDTPMKSQFPKEKHGRIIYAQLNSGTVEISAADWMATVKPVRGNMFSIHITGKTYDELKTVFDKLAKGADKEGLQELHDVPFGIYGQLRDTYGVVWQFKGERRAVRKGRP